jgi:hypothetical protein
VWTRRQALVMAGLDPAIHVADTALFCEKRGSPGQAR